MQVTASQVKQISVNHGRDDICAMIANSINNLGGQFQLDTPLRIKHFLGQMCIESGFFSKLEENLNYSKPERLMQVWPSRFPTIASAQPFVNNPKALADKVYSNRSDLGNGPGDGYPYRGSSITGLTGRSHFREFTKWIKSVNPSAPDFEQYPDLLRTLEWAVWPALWYWKTKNCAMYADRDDVKGLTRAINGGLTGIDDRTQATALSGKVLNMATNPEVVSAKPATADPLLKEYQDKLNQISIKLNRPEFNVGTADGWNGPKTFNAVSAFQKYVTLNVDGKIGPNTRAAIDKLLSK